MLRWLKRYLAEGIEGLQEALRPGRPAEMTAVYEPALLAAIRRYPRNLGLLFSIRTLQRLGDYLAYVYSLYCSPLRAQVQQESRLWLTGRRSAMQRRKWDARAKAIIVIEGLKGKLVEASCHEHQISQ